MNYAAIKATDVANGPGVRVSLFVSGCTHYCQDCFNSEAWDFSFGKPYTDNTTQEIITDLDHSYIAGLSLLGGEPLHPDNRKEVLRLIDAVRERMPGKTIWCYTGYKYDRELLPESEKTGEGAEMLRNILSQTDVLVDGRFQPDYKDLKLRFRGSSNQRIIRMPETLEKGNIVLWN